MEFQRNSLFLSLPTVVLHMSSSLGADCKIPPRDAAFASATINCWEKTFLELGSFSAMPFPKSAWYWPANGVLTDPLVTTSIWTPANSRNQGTPLWRELPAQSQGFGSGSFVYPKNQILFSHKAFITV